MSGDHPSELPQHYGSKSSDGELIRRPLTPILTTPRRPYNPNPRGFSPERTSVDVPQYTDPEFPRTSGGLRRRPSGNANPPLSRRWSGGEYDRERPNFSSVEISSRKASRSRDDQYYAADDYDRYYPPRAHPDQYERSRPPRTYRNVDGWEKGPSSASKPFFDESRSDYNRDLERGEESPWRKKSGGSAESVDGYDYENARNPDRRIDLSNLTPQERAEVMRLPFIQWMNSDFKNRKSFQSDSA